MQATITPQEPAAEICSRSVLLEAPVETVFAFCTSAAGFIAHYPNPIKNYRGPAVWLLGSEFWLDYRFLGIPSRWHGKVTGYELNRSFTDVMVSGMLRFWEHTHTVESVSGGTRYTDSVKFRMGFGRWLDRHVVKAMLDTFFARRHEMLRAALQRKVSQTRADSMSHG